MQVNHRKEAGAAIYAGVYTIRCLVNGAIYVGSSKNVPRRLDSHLGLLRKGEHKNDSLQSDWNAYGEGRFVLEMLPWENPSIGLLDAEQRAIDDCRKLTKVYNICSASSGGKKSFSIPAHIDQWLRQLAAAQNRSVSSLVSQLLTFEKERIEARGGN